MKTRRLFLTLLLTLTVLGAFAPRVRATNEGDWVEISSIQWWWKYVRSVNDPHRIDVSRVEVAQVRSTQVGYVAQQVTFTLTNNSSTDYKGGESFRLDYMVSEGDPVPWAFVTIGKGSTPALSPGRSAQVSGIAYTPEKGKFNHFVTLSVGQ